MNKNISALASALRKVVGERLRQSKVGIVWHDDRTWHSIAKELADNMDTKFVVLTKEAYAKLYEDAARWKRVEASVAAYHALREQTKPAAGESNWYANWAKNNMKEEKKDGSK